MNKPLLFLLLMMASATCGAALYPDARPSHLPGEAIVVYESASAKRASARLGIPVRKTLLNGRAELLTVPAFMHTEQAIKAWAQEPGVLRVEPNALRYRYQSAPNDPLFPELWGILNSGQANYVAGGPASTPGGDMNLLAAWDPAGDGSFTRTGDGTVVIAIIDDAFDTAHSELAANFQPGQDFANNDPDPRPDDSSVQVHGTLVAGSAAAIGNNGSQLAGSIWNVSLLPFKVSRIVVQGGAPDAIFDTASILQAYQAAIDRGAHIVNASFGGPTFSQTELDLIRDMRDAGILFVASAGNDDSNLDASVINYPANYDVENLLAVAATNRQDNIASFSVYGPSSVDVAAPGLQIVSTLPGNATTPVVPGQSGGVSGTSFAAPYTAGVAALIKNYVAAVSTEEIFARLVESGSALSSSNPDRLTRGGRIDAAAALDMVPGPALVLRSVRFDDGPGGNDVADPGESLDLVLELENLWLPATNVAVAARIEAGNAIVLDAPIQIIGAVPGVVSRPNNRVTARFPIRVTGPSNRHQYLDLSFQITADGGYDRRRYTRLEYGSLDADIQTVDSFVGRNADLYDEFHAWHFTLTQAAESLTITTSTAGGEDIDLLVRKGKPPEYLITVGIDPENAAGGFFETDSQTLISGRADGNETVTISQPGAGTYHIVVVNFDQADTAQSYTLKAAVQRDPVTTPPPASGGGGGGGALSAAGLLLLLFGAWRRRADGR